MNAKLAHAPYCTPCYLSYTNNVHLNNYSNDRFALLLNATLLLERLHRKIDNVTSVTPDEKSATAKLKSTDNASDRISVASEMEE